MTAGTTLMGSTPQMRADARIFDRDLSTAFLVTLPLPVSARSAIALLSSARVIGVSSAPASANNSRRPKSRVSSSSAARLTDARCCARPLRTTIVLGGGTARSGRRRSNSVNSASLRAESQSVRLSAAELPAGVPRVSVIRYQIRDLVCTA